MQNTHKPRQKEHRAHATHISHATHIAPNTHKTYSTQSLAGCTMPNTQLVHRGISHNTRYLTQLAKHTDHTTQTQITEQHITQHTQKLISQLITHATPLH